MSIKRSATTDLNHENWDKEDPEEHEEMGTFKTASKDEIEKRVIRTAKRRSQASDPKTSVFSGFGGFNKPKPSSFDFLANVTNGGKLNGSPAKNEEAVSSSLFSSKPLSGSPFQAAPASSGTSYNCGTLGSSSAPNLLFGISSTSTPPTKTNPLFSGSKADSTVNDSPFKIASSTNETKNTGFSFKPNVTSSSTSQVSSTIFGAPSATSNKSLFSNTAAQSIAITNATSPTNFKKTDEETKKTDSESIEQGKGTSDDKKVKYYANLKGLNESVSEWIRKHVEATPLCILTPIFKDYEKHLKQIQDEYEKDDDVKEKDSNSSLSTTSTSIFSGNKSNPLLGPKDKTITPFSSTTSFTSSESSLKSSSTFSFGVKKDTAANNLSSSSTSTINTNGGAAPFSFGTGKPFSFSPNTQKPPETPANETKGENDEDEPQKVEFTPVVEDNSVYDKRCKIFVKKDENFADKGVGTLYIKKLESGKHQLLVRANTNLGTVLLNFILGKAIPTQRMGKNNVMLVCIPTPDAKPPPIPILIRVKTGEEADELLETLNKHKA